MPIAALATEPDRGGRRARLRLLLAVRTVGAASSQPPLELREKEVEVQVPSDASAAASREFVVEVPLDEGEHELALGVHDALSGRATYRVLRVD